MSGKPTIKLTTAQAYCKQFPEIKDLTLAKKMYEENRRIFPHTEDARSFIRRVRGHMGKKNLKEIANKEFFTPLSYDTTNSPRPYKEQINTSARVLVADVETAPIRAYVWGIWNQNVAINQIQSDWFCLTWSAKWLFEDKVYSGKLTPKEVHKQDDKRIIKGIWELVNQADIVIAHNGCVTPGHKILKSDFTWCNVEDLKEGDTLLAFQENSDGNKVPRKFELSTVIKNIPIQKECSIIELEDGTKLTASNDHPWLVRFSEKHKHWGWKNTEDLTKRARVRKSENVMSKIFDTWEESSSYHAGYLAGFFDADGCLAVSQRKDRINGFIFSCTFAQKDPFIIEKLKESLDFFGFKYSILSYDKKHRDIKKITILGRLSEKIKFLGIVNPKKKFRFPFDKFCQIKMSGIKDLKIKSVTPIGVQTVCGLETSSRTYIVEGFPCHNTKFDIPKLNSRFIVNGLNPPLPYQTIDTLAHIRRQFGFTSNKLDYVNKLLNLERKTDTGGFELWERCMLGEQAALDEMERYNINDVRILEETYLHIRPWIKPHPNMGLFILDENQFHCPSCGSADMKEEGKGYHTTVNIYTAMRCENCGATARKRTSEISIKKRRFVLQSSPK